MIIDFTAARARIESLREHTTEFRPTATLIERFRLLPADQFSEIVVTALEESK